MQEKYSSIGFLLFCGCFYPDVFLCFQKMCIRDSGIPIIMAGLDVTEKAMIFPEDFERIRALGNHVAVIVADWLEFFYQFHRSLGYEGAPVHDAVAVAALLRPELMESKDLYVQVETAGDFCKGATVADFNGVLGLSLIHI